MTPDDLITLFFFFRDRHQRESARTHKSGVPSKPAEALFVRGNKLKGTTETTNTPNNKATPSFQVKHDTVMTPESVAGVKEFQPSLNYSHQTETSQTAVFNQARNASSSRGGRGGYSFT